MRERENVRRGGKQRSKSKGEEAGGGSLTEALFARAVPSLHHRSGFSGER